MRSWIQPIHGAWRSSTASDKTQYRVMKMMICGMMGRQPPTGLILALSNLLAGAELDEVTP